MPLNQPGVLRVTEGSYTGNTGALRQITVGFKCSLVLIQKSARTWTLIRNVSACNHHYNTTPFHVDRSAQGLQLHATDGFVVDSDDNGANGNALGYGYWAVSQ